jgi:hypothetical protein
VIVQGVISKSNHPMQTPLLLLTPINRDNVMPFTADYRDELKSQKQTRSDFQNAKREVQRINNPSIGSEVIAFK